MSIILPKELEELRDRKIWICHPLIWDEKKHNGLGGYAKPPINPYTLYPGHTDQPEERSTFDHAAAQIGKKARVRLQGVEGYYECDVAGVGIALEGTGLAALDLDSVIKVDGDRRVMKREAGEIVELMDTYTEISPSDVGLRLLFWEKDLAAFFEAQDRKKAIRQRPDYTGSNKAEYQFFTSGYVTITGNVVGYHALAERTWRAKLIHRFYFEYPVVMDHNEKLIGELKDQIENRKPTDEAKPAKPFPVVSCSNAFTRDKWLKYISTLSDNEILEAIFKSPQIGERVRALYDGNMSDYDNDHSRADMALCMFLYGFTDDINATERLFKASSLYRPTGKSSRYLENMLRDAVEKGKPLIGHIDHSFLTAEDKKAYAVAKEYEEDSIKAKEQGFESVEAYRRRYSDAVRKRYGNNKGSGYRYNSKTKGASKR